MIPVLSDREVLADMAAAASTLEERMRGSDFVVRAYDEKEVQARLETWCKVVAGGNWDLFRQRLAWDGWNSAQVKPLLGTMRLREGAPLPAWTETIEAVMRVARRCSEVSEQCLAGTEGLARCLKADELIAFEEVLLPFVEVARQRVQAHNEMVSRTFAPEALAILERSLLQQLAQTAGQALFLEFSIYRAQALSGLTRFMIEQEGSDSHDIYDEFVEELLAEGLLPLFERYPVLARLLATISDCWVETTLEVTRRIVADAQILEEVFAIQRGQQVSAIETGLSDEHHGRRTVLVLTFGKDQKVVYKPKDMGIEEAYNQFLRWCNEQVNKTPACSMRLDFKVLQVVKRDGYGWVEYAGPQSCQQEDEVKRYFQRAGMLLCLVYALHGTDCHQENVVAHGEYPVIIDVETLMQHRARLESISDGAQAQLLAHEMISDSVLHTCLLPSWQVSQDDQQVYDISGLRGPDEYVHETEANYWEGINTDAMALKRKLVRLESAAISTAQQGVALRLAEHQEEVIAGFTSFYRFLLEKKELLLQAGSPLYLFERQPLRLIYRSTQVYGTLEYRLRTPRFLRNGIDRSIELEALVIAVLPAPDVLDKHPGRSRWWPMYMQEQREMEQMDVPFFRTNAGSDAVWLSSGQRLEACFEEAGFERALARVRDLDQEDMELQVSFIAGSLYSLAARDTSSSLPLARKVASLDASLSTDEDLNQRMLLHALRIGEQIEQNALRAADGSLSWIIPQYMFKSKRYQLQPIASDLYSGSCGIALFLASLCAVTGESCFRALALGAIQALRAGLHTYGPKITKDLGLGAASGLASLLYCFVRISQLIDEPVLLDDARFVASLITFEEIAGDGHVDIFAGAAGTIFGLLTLHAVTGESELLEKARTCGQQLLQKRVETESGYRAWPGLLEKRLTGFSHGAAGITYALLRLYEVTGEQAYREAAREGIAYEDSMYLPEINNWPDLRSGIANDQRVAWCHGAPGIGLARVGGLALLRDEQIERDIEIALRRTEDEGLQSLDHVCCGNMGRVEFLLSASCVLKRPELLHTARQMVARIMQEAERTGHFALDPLLPPQVNNFGFFQGTAGTGYMLLRMYAPDRLPNVLLWR